MADRPYRRSGSAAEGVKILLVGQGPNSRGSGEPLQGRIRTALCDLLRIPVDDYGKMFDTTNVLDKYYGRNNESGDAFPTANARRRARKIVRDSFRDHDTIVLLGRKTYDAFRRSVGLPASAPFCSVWTRALWRIALIPHPSGRCRWWNDPLNRRRARIFLRRIIEERKR